MARWIPTGVDMLTADGERVFMVLSVDYDRAIARIVWFYPRYQHEDVPLDVALAAIVQNCPGCGRAAKSTIRTGVTRFRTSRAPSEPWRHESWHIDCYNDRQASEQFPVTVGEID